MKYKVKFSYAFADTANPKRFKKTVTIDADLEFPFPKQTDDVILALKASDAERYKTLKLEQFETYTGVTAAKFQSSFDTNIKKKIDANFVDYVKKVAKPDFDESQWDKLLSFFETKQVEFLKDAFAKGLADIVKVNYEKLEKLKAAAPKPNESRQLDVDQAFLLWCGKNPIKFKKVEDKFYGDHIKKEVSAAIAFDWAVERYKKNKNVKTSSLVEASPSTVLNKANGGKAYPSVFKGAQQIAVKVTCDVLTAVLEENKVVGDKAAAQFKKDNKHWAQVGDVWLSATFKKGTQSFYVMGTWDPDSGDAELYHYQNEDAKPPMALLPEYRRWTYSNKEGKFLGPTRDGH
ncbi:hypothetical protein [Roseateles sp.]|uniref:hypothetical protein n=1 Tax=Roseateles sp. TaxID=1971397 RepID=UPI003BAB67B9